MPQNPPDTPARNSALDGWIDVMRTGTFTGGSGGEQTYTAADLAQIAADYATGDPAPVVVGHPEANAPAWGWVGGLRAVGDRLQAKLDRIDDGFRTAVEAGRYAARSVAISRPSGETGWRLWHLGFLGGAQPAIDGLAPSQFAAATPKDAIRHEFNLPLGGEDERLGWWTLETVLRNLREWIIERSTIEHADRIVPRWNLDHIKGLGEPDPSDMAALAARISALCAPYQSSASATEVPMPDDTPKQTPPAGDAAQLARDRAALKADRAALAADRKKLEAEQLAAAATARLSQARDQVEAHVTAGRVLPAERAGLVALFAALGGAEARITLAAPDGGVQEKSQTDVLEAFLSALPKRGPNLSELAAPGATPVPTASGSELPDGMTVDQLVRAGAAQLAADTTGKMNSAEAVRSALKGD